MVEIALSLAIIAFALVAIIGVLPSGMTVQRDNRWHTIINEDGQFWLNAIRNGAQDVPDLAGHVIEVYTNRPPASPRLTPATPAEVVGLLSTPYTINRARVRALSSSAAEQGPNAQVGLEYYLFTEINHAFPSASPALSNNLYEVRLVFRWPAFPVEGFGHFKKVFRTYVRGQLVETNTLHFFDTQSMRVQ